MFSIPSFYELGGYSNSFDIIPRVLSTSIDNGNENLSPKSMAEAKAVAASISHKEAERRRRKRINAHIATLKSILPNTIKTDKASLLAEAVRHVKELKKTTAQLTTPNDETTNDKNPSNNTWKLMFPSETDELKLTRCDNLGLIKATLCCEDRPEITRDIINALKSVEAKVVGAEMSTMGGRTKSVLWVNVESESDVVLGTLRRALKMIIEKSILLPGSGQNLPGNKRTRYYH